MDMTTNKYSFFISIPSAILLISSVLIVFISCKENRCNEMIDHYYDNQYVGINCCSVKYHILPRVTDFMCSDSFVIIEQKPDLERQRYILAANIRMDIDKISNGCQCKKKVINNLFNLEYLSLDSFKFDSVGKLMSANNSRQDQEILRMYADLLLKSDSFYVRVNKSPVNYWILRITPDTVFQFGPLSFSEYLFARNHLDIPESLKLSCEIELEHY